MGKEGHSEHKEELRFSLEANLQAQSREYKNQRRTREQGS